MIQFYAHHRNALHRCLGFHRYLSEILAGIDDKRSKKKISLIFGYLGSNYKGLQFSPLETVRTVEAEMKDALYKAGYITERNMENLKKIQWSAQSRTDKGVHANRTLVSGKLEVFASKILSNGSIPSLVDEVNTLLPLDIRLFSAFRVRNQFNARTDCSWREYHYFMPVYLINACSSSQEVPMSHISQILKQFEGIQSFHNFTKGTDYKLSKKRNVVYQCDVSRYNDDYITIKFYAGRKMIGACLVALKFGEPKLVKLALAEAKDGLYSIPIAPPDGLVLMNSGFMRRGNAKGRDEDSSSSSLTDLASCFLTPEDDERTKQFFETVIFPEMKSLWTSNRDSHIKQLEEFVSKSSVQTLIESVRNMKEQDDNDDEIKSTASHKSRRVSFFYDFLYKHRFDIKNLSRMIQSRYRKGLPPKFITQLSIHLGTTPGPEIKLVCISLVSCVFIDYWHQIKGGSNSDGLLLVELSCIDLIKRLTETLPSLHLPGIATDTTVKPENWKVWARAGQLISRELDVCLALERRLKESTDKTELMKKIEEIFDSSN